MTMTKIGNLAVSLPSDTEIVMTREFAAPRKLVFECWTKPELLSRWLLGPPGWTMPVCEIDLKVGGAYRYLWRNVANPSKEFGSSGHYTEIQAPSRLRCTELFDGEPPESEAVNSLTFIEAGGKTTLVTTMRVASKELRDRIVSTGMAKGVEASYVALDAMLAKGSVMNNPKDCSIVEVSCQPTAAIKGEVPFSRMRQAHQEARAKLLAALPTLNAGKTGLFVTRTGMPTAKGLYMEIGLMVAKDFAPAGDIVPSELPAGRAAHYKLVGGFENLPSAWPFLMGWVAEQGLKPAGINWEVYGATAADPAKQETDLYLLLA